MSASLPSRTPECQTLEIRTPDSRTSDGRTRGIRGHRPPGAADVAGAKPGEALIGTSGWTYDGWRGPFYPAPLPKTQWLAWYATQFATTEINGSFYRTPSLDAVRRWRDSTPETFVFSWKASKFITHWKRLGPTTENSIALMETRLQALAPKLAVVLFQLPPQFPKNRERLAAFVAALPRRRRYAFEFRHPSWYEDDILDLLRENDVALCLSDHHDAPAPWIATARHVYVRAHGPTGRYRDRYSEQMLRALARRVRSWQRQKRLVLVYFDNDQKSAAPQDARRLRELTGRRARRRTSHSPGTRASRPRISRT
ncbi:MAG: DUF72 domain-containing protein [Hyphomicrobiales bacterium]|nr:DUF72 domain-containing protein [Hyphomicrobiales bacterium]